MNIPRFYCYGKYTGSYGMNAVKLELGSISLWFSYRTIVAFSTREDGLVVSENIWGATTGKHLNWILLDHEARIPRNQFILKLQAALKRHTQDEDLTVILSVNGGVVTVDRVPQNVVVLVDENDAHRRYKVDHTLTEEFLGELS